MKVKDEGEKADLNIQKMKIMASSPILANKWGNNRNSHRCYILGSKITADCDEITTKLKDTCSLEEKL